MQKRISFFQIFMTIMSVIIAGLLLATGMIAVQKSMRLNLSFKASPVVYCELKIGEEVIFNNKTSKIGGGVESISGNTLTFNKEKLACTIGLTTFNLTITNLEDTQSAISVGFENANVGGTENFVDVVPLECTTTYAITTLGSFEISFEKVYPVTLANSPTVAIDTENSSIITQKGVSYVVATNENATIKLTPANGFTSPVVLNSITISGDAFANYTYSENTGILTLPKSALNGNISIQAAATEKPAEITLSHNITNMTISNTTIEIDKDFVTTLTLASGLNTVYTSENTTAYTIPNHENMTITLTPPNASAITLTYNASENGYTYTTSETSITITITASVINQLFSNNNDTFGTLSLSAYAPRYVVGSGGDVESGDDYNARYLISNRTIIEGQMFSGRSSSEFNMGMWWFYIKVVQSDGSVKSFEAENTSYTTQYGYEYFTYDIPASIFTEGDYQIFYTDTVKSVVFEPGYDPRAVL